MVAPHGNKHNLKLKTPQLRKEAYEAYCAHTASGLSKRCFVFKTKDISVTYRAVEDCMKTYSVELDPVHIEIAECESLKKWELIAERMCMGQIRGSNPAVLQMIMRNKFGWDKEHRDKQTNQAAVIELLNLMEKRVA